MGKKTQPKHNYKFKDENFFDVIDSEEKAYFLGLIFADGSLNDKLRTLQLSLVDSDSEVLEKFIKLIYHDRELRTIWPKKWNHSIQNKLL